MIINKEILIDRLNNLKLQLRQENEKNRILCSSLEESEVRMNALNGAIEDCNFWIQYEAQEPEKKLKKVETNK